MVCTIHGKHSDFCMGWALSIQCAMMQHATAVDRCHVCPLLTNTCLVNPPVEPHIGYPVGSVIKKWFSCQWNQPFGEDVPYCLSCLFLSSPLLFKGRCHSPTLQCHAELCVDHQTVTDWSQFCHKAMSDFILSCSLQLFLCWLVGGGGKIVEIDQSCFIRRKCNCSGLCVRAWVFVDIERELGIPVLNLSLIALPRHYSPSLRRVSNMVPQSSVTVVGTMFVSSMKDSHTTLSIAPTFLWCTDAHTNMIKATWKHINICLRPYWEHEVKCVINRFKGSPSA